MYMCVYICIYYRKRERERERERARERESDRERERERKRKRKRAQYKNPGIALRPRYILYLNPFGKAYGFFVKAKSPELSSPPGRARLNGST